MADDSKNIKDSFPPAPNPYHPPSLSASEEDSLDGPAYRRRPLGIAILSVLHGLGSVGILVFLVFLAGTQGAREWADRSNLSHLVVVAVGAVSGALGLASAYGMWTGAKWGWWLAAWYYFLNALGHGMALVASPLLPVVNDEDAFLAFVIKHSGRFIIYFLLVLYIFRLRVMRFFGLQSMSKWKAVAYLFGTSVAFFLLLFLGIGSYFVATRGLPPAFR